MFSVKAFILVTGLLTVVPALAAPVVDQNTLVTLSEGRQWYSGSSTFLTASDWQDQVQTFTAGVTGKLSSIDLQAYYSAVSGYSNAPVRTFSLTVFNGNGYTNPETVVGSTTFSSLEASVAVGDKFNVDLAALNFEVTADSEYSFRVSTSTPGGKINFITGTIAGITPEGEFIDRQINTYPGGQAYVISKGGNSTVLADRGFVTYVDAVTPVPEVGEWAMMAAGFGIVSGLTRRRRHLQVFRDPC